MVYTNVYKKDSKNPADGEVYSIAHCDTRISIEDFVKISKKKLAEKYPDIAAQVEKETFAASGGKVVIIGSDWKYTITVGEGRDNRSDSIWECICKTTPLPKQVRLLTPS
ncbi:hypothetical protein GGH95_003873 [Coemansia sp. RSA 1836]|nr:hypothetical protein GGH95_003873 [Coemansia sp. RSA 1836]